MVKTNSMLKFDFMAEVVVIIKFNLMPIKQVVRVFINLIIS